MKYSLLSLVILVLVLSFSSLLVSGNSFLPIPEDSKNGNNSAVCYRILGIESTDDLNKAVKLGEKLLSFNSSAYVVANFSYEEQDWNNRKSNFSELLNNISIASPFVIKGCNDRDIEYVGNLAEFEAIVKGAQGVQEPKEPKEPKEPEEPKEPKEPEEPKEPKEPKDPRTEQDKLFSSLFEPIPTTSKNGNDTAVCYRILGIESTDEFEKGTKLGEELRLSNPNAYVVANCSYSQQNWDTKKPGFSKFLNKIDIPSLFVIEGCDNQDVKYVGDLTEFETFVTSATNDASFVFGSSLAVFVTAAVFSVLAVI